MIGILYLLQNWDRCAQSKMWNLELQNFDQNLVAKLHFILEFPACCHIHANIRWRLVGRCWIAYQP